MTTDHLPLIKAEFKIYYSLNSQKTKQFTNVLCTFIISTPITPIISHYILYDNDEIVKVFITFIVSTKLKKKLKIKAR